jgi:hypothetical protein
LLLAFPDLGWIIAVLKEIKHEDVVRAKSEINYRSQNDSGSEYQYLILIVVFLRIKEPCDSRCTHFPKIGEAD